MEDTQAFQALVERSVQAMRDEQFAEAKPLLLDILRQQPHSMQALNHLGVAYYQLGQISGALACFSRLILRHPDRLEFYKNSLVVYRSLQGIKGKALLEQQKRPPPWPAERQAPVRAPQATHVLVLCAGEATRWQSHMQTPRKHLVQLEGEVLLARTLRQVAAYQPQRVTVLVRPGDEALYRPVCPAHVQLHAIDEVPLPQQTPAWKYLSSESQWNRGGRTISLLGDVWFSDGAMDTIFNWQGHGWWSFGRSGASALTGCPYGEIFAHRFDDVSEHAQALAQLDELYRIQACIEQASGWALLQLMTQQDPNVRVVGERFVEIDDFTEDFDYPQDYDNWVRHRAQHQAASGAAQT